MKTITVLLALFAWFVMSSPAAPAFADVAPSAPALAGSVPSSSFVVGGTHVDVYGSGSPALILVPGLTDGAAVWGGTVARFAPTHTVYALTLAGFGGTPPVAAPMVDAALSDIVALIAREHLVRPVLIGHSLGGFTTLRFAEEHGALLSGAVAVDGLPVFVGLDEMTPAERSGIGVQASAQLMALTADELYAGGKARTIPYLTQSRNVERVASFGRGADPKATAEYIRELIASDVRPALAAVTVPLLEIVPFDATLDPVNPQTPFKTAALKEAYYTKMLANDRRASVRLIDDSRHFVMIDQPEKFYAAIDAFLASLK